MDEIRISFEMANAPGHDPEHEAETRADLINAIKAVEKTCKARTVSPDDVLDALRQLYDLGMHGPASIGIVIDWDPNARTFSKNYFLAAKGTGTPDSTHIRIKMFGKGAIVSFFRARTARKKMTIDAGRENAAECVLRKVEKSLNCAYKKEKLDFI
jgi:hypothetical protein